MNETCDEFQKKVAGYVASHNERIRSLYAQFGIPAEMRVSAYADAESKVFIVARKHNVVVFFDPTEDEFGIGRMNDDIVMQEGIYGDFEYALAALADL